MRWHASRGRAGGPGRWPRARAAGLAAALLSLVTLVTAPPGRAQAPSAREGTDGSPPAALDGVPALTLAVPGGEIQVGIVPGPLALSRAALLAWIEQSARAVAVYYGRFPSSHTRLLVQLRHGRGVSGGRAWGGRGAAIRIAVGEHTSQAELEQDWVLVHEMTHLAFPSMPTRHRWIEEGLATYVEPIARAQAGRLDAAAVWSELVAGLPQGLPQPGDRGLDHTPTWGRTYWGGALFALLADLEIRRRTDDRLGLQHALRAILAAGNIETSGTLPAVLDTGDRAVGVPVLRELYERMRDAPAPVDLDALWEELGVRRRGDRLVLDDTAPRAATRRAITAPPVDAARRPAPVGLRPGAPTGPGR